MTIKNQMRLLGLAVALWLAACGSQEYDMSDLPEQVPAACSEYCEAYHDCEYPEDYFEGEYGDEHFEALIEWCKVDCGWYLSEGAYVIYSDWNDESSEHEYVEFIPGGRITAYYKCLMNTDLHECEDFDGWGYYELYPGDEDECGKVAECWDKLESEELGEVVWQGNGSGHCSLDQDIGEQESLYLDFPYDSLEFYGDY